MSFADDARSNSRRLGACSQRVSVVNSAKTAPSPLAGEGWGEGATKTSPPNARSLGRARSGFTLVEMLVAVGLTLLLMTMVVSVMSQVMEAVSTSRSTIEMSDRLRFARERIQKDLAGTTLFPNPPHKPESGEGYFEYIEGPMGPPAATKIVPGGSKIATPLNGTHALDTDESGATTYPSYDFTGYDNTTNAYAADNTVGDLDDILMFTSRAQDESFVGRFTAYNAGGVILATDGNPYNPAAGNPPMATYMVESRVAEVSYFVRGTTLYRRVLLVLPNGVTIAGGPATIPPRGTLSDSAGGQYGYQALFDISARVESGPYNLTPNSSEGNARLLANSLGDLTKREHRYGHQPYQFPHDARVWGALGLPILEEASDWRWPFPWNGEVPSNTPPGATINPSGWMSGNYPLPQIVPSGNGGQLWGASGSTRADLTLSTALPFDAWRTPLPWNQVDRVSGRIVDYNQGTRVSEDVLLTNVVSFDVKVWDPGAPLIELSGIVYQPGDASYLHVIDPANGLAPTVSSFGAFVDLWGFRSLDANNDGVIQTPGEYALSAGQPAPNFLYRGNPSSQLVGSLKNATLPYWPAVYDTWSTNYEQDGIDQDGMYNADQGTNGLDDDNANGVDDPGEQEAPPPYAYPLRAIQIKLRVFEPDSRQIREVTIVHEFLPQ